MIRVTMNMPTLDDKAVIPTAGEGHLSKCFRTTKTLQWQKIAEPNPPVTENIKKKSWKLYVNELAQKPIDIIRHPLMAVILNPKRLIRRVANDPKI